MNDLGKRTLPRIKGRCIPYRQWIVCYLDIRSESTQPGSSSHLIHRMCFLAAVLLSVLLSLAIANAPYPPREFYVLATHFTQTSQEKYFQLYTSIRIAMPTHDGSKGNKQTIPKKG